MWDSVKMLIDGIRVRNLKFARYLIFATSKTLVNFMKKMMFWYFSVQKALIYYTFNKSHHNSFILLVFSHVTNFRYVANFRFLTLLKKLLVDHGENFNMLRVKGRRFTFCKICGLSWRLSRSCYPIRRVKINKTERGFSLLAWATKPSEIRVVHWSGHPSKY